MPRPAKAALRSLTLDQIRAALRRELLAEHAALAARLREIDAQLSELGVDQRRVPRGSTVPDRRRGPRPGSLTFAVLQALKPGKDWRASTIVRAVETDGFRTRGNLPNMVSNSLTAMTRAGRIKRVKRGVYRAK